MAHVCVLKSFMILSVAGVRVCGGTGGRKTRRQRCRSGQLSSRARVPQSSLTSGIGHRLHGSARVRSCVYVAPRAREHVLTVIVVGKLSLDAVEVLKRICSGVVCQLSQSSSVQGGHAVVPLTLSGA